MASDRSKKPLTLAAVARGEATKREVRAITREVRRVVRDAAPLESLDAALLLAQVMGEELSEDDDLTTLPELMRRAERDPRAEVALRVIRDRDQYRTALLDADRKRIENAEKPRNKRVTPEQVARWLSEQLAMGQKATVEEGAAHFRISEWLFRKLRNNKSRQ